MEQRDPDKMRHGLPAELLPEALGHAK